MLLPPGEDAEAFGDFQEFVYAVPVSTGIGELERLVDVGPLQCRTPLAVGEINVELSSAEAQLVRRAFDGKQLVARFRSGIGGEKGHQQFGGIDARALLERVAGDDVS